MKIFKSFFIYMLIANIILVVTNVYYIYQLIFIYKSLSMSLSIQLLVGILIQCLFIYLAKYKNKIVFPLVVLSGIYIYYMASTSFGLMVVLKSSIENFNVNTLINFLNPIVALVALLYWWYELSEKNKK